MFHRQLKAALMAHENPTRWASLLPVVLLGIRTTLKTDIGCSSAELVYGTALRLPTDFFCHSEPSTISHSSYLENLQRIFHDVRPTPTRASPSRQPFVPQLLSTASHVFLRRDAVRRPLQQPYSGPHPVLQRADKFFKISVNGKPDSVSVDRLKPAFTKPPLSSFPLSALAPSPLPAHHAPDSSTAPKKRVSWADRSSRSLAGGPCSGRR
ncbi:uncharacterized protein LOC135373341 [Ornithodoros turicata]|uniref:uncharacterized protein LOC135373341 n=1 Tax=Ornithodoros turicata TaxID=34597 RepID=UPI003139234B